MNKISEKQKERKIKEKEKTENLHRLFREIWDEQEDEQGFCYCFETGKPLHGSIYRSNTGCYHHILEKGIKSYPEYTNNKQNIVIVCPQIHQQTHKSIEKVPKIKAYREQLLSLHKEGKLEKDEDKYDSCIED